MTTDSPATLTASTGGPPPEPPSAAVSGARTEARRRGGAILALARFEARELLLQAPMVLLFLLYVVFVAARMVLQEGMDDYPVLNQVDRATQGAPLLFALAVLICTNAAALRSRRHATAQQFDVLAMEPWRRTVAHVLSVVPYAALVGVVVLAEFAREALKPDAVGHGSIGELAVAPLTILLAGVLGVLLARLVPFGFAPLVFVIGLYVAMVVASQAAEDGKPWGWLSPLQLYSDTGDTPVPADLLGRPAGWHAVYLLGLCAVLACAAVLRAGGGTRVVTAATVVALATTAVGATGQLSRDTATLDKARRTASAHPEKVQSCTKIDGSTYCSFPEWNGVRDDWAGIVGRVRSLAGGEAATTSLTVRQRIDVTYGIDSNASLMPSGTPGQVTVGTRWGGNRVPEFAAGVASVLVGGREDVSLGEMCRDARMVTIMWLVLGADPNPLETFRHVRLDDSTEGSAVVLAPTNSLSMTAPQTTVVRELLDRPRAEVTALVKQHWTELTSTGTTTAEAAKLLGVKKPKEPDTCDEE